jgi:hypothetical protein
MAKAAKRKRKAKATAPDIWKDRHAMKRELARQGRLNRQITRLSKQLRRAMADADREVRAFAADILGAVELADAGREARPVSKK